MISRGVWLAKNDFGLVFSSAVQQSTLFGMVSVLRNRLWFWFFDSVFALCVV